MKMVRFDPFSSDLIETRYPNFPYPDKNCPYCNKILTLAKTIHIKSMPFEFKCVYVCYNPSCDAYDEPGDRAYVKVYYSSEYAAKVLDYIRVNVDDRPYKR